MAKSHMKKNSDQRDLIKVHDFGQHRKESVSEYSNEANIFTSEILFPFVLFCFSLDIYLEESSSQMSICMSST